MRFTILVVLFLLSMNCFGVSPPNTTCVSAPLIPSAFTSVNSQVVSGIGLKTNMIVVNLSDVNMVACYTAKTEAGCTDNMILIPNSSLTMLNVKPGDFINLRTNGGSATTGDVCAGGW